MNNVKFFLVFGVVAFLLQSCTSEHPHSSGVAKNNLEQWANDASAISIFRSDTLKDDDQRWDVVGPKTNKDTLIRTLLRAALKGDLKTYHAVLNEDELISPEELKKMVSRIDTLQVEDINNPGTFKTVVMSYDLGPADISQVVFREKWYFDPLSYTMQKKVDAVCFCQESIDEQGNSRGIRPLFWIHLNNDKQQ